MYNRFILRRSDKDPQKIANKHDEIYSALDKMFSQVTKPISNESIIDTKFFIDELADNFLVHDDRFNKANIDIWIDRDTLDVHIQVSHDGREFDPLHENSPCENIRSAADRLRTKPAYNDPHSHLENKIKLSYNLDK